MSTLEIVVPYFRGQRYLRECIDSVIRQSQTDWLCTLIDDASPDSFARELVDELADDRIRYLRHHENQGIAATFSAALRSSRAQWTTILGQDDRLLPDYVKTVTAAATIVPSTVTMIQPGVRVIDAQGTIARPLADKIKTALRPWGPGVYGGQALAASLLLGNWLYFPAISWRTSAAAQIGFDPRLRTAMDLEHILRQIVLGHQLYLESTPCFEYRRHRCSESAVAAGSTRFAEERALHTRWAVELRGRGWRSASMMARLAVTSRLHRMVAGVPRGGPATTGQHSPGSHQERSVQQPRRG